MTAAERQAAAAMLLQYASDLQANECSVVWERAEFVDDVRSYAADVAAGKIDLDAR